MVTIQSTFVILGICTVLLGAACKPNEAERAAAERQQELDARQAEFRRLGERRDAAYKYAMGLRAALTTLIFSDWSELDKYRAAMATVDVQRALVRQRYEEELDVEMKRIEGLLEYLTRGLEDTNDLHWADKFAANFPNEKLNKVLGLEKKDVILNRRKTTVKFNLAMEPLAKAADIMDLLGKTDERY